MRFPHCDPKILHGPSANCDFCDEHRDWQHLRIHWGINFTGETRQDRVPCPATHARTLADVYASPGNRPARRA